MRYDELDRELLTNLSEREAQIVADATRRAYNRCGDWLSMKQARSAQYPGGEYTRGRAEAYQNAAQEIYGWAIETELEKIAADAHAAACGKKW